MPDDLRWVEHPATGERLAIVPGQLRQRDVQVGRHVAISPGAVPRFLKRYEAVFSRLGKSETVLAAAGAHHRLAWIHPFLDGNGRVGRPISHTMLLRTLDTGAVWSVARGLARNVQAYKTHLANCDMRRRNDLDGRGTLSEEALVEFTDFFLRACLDQVSFMEGLMRPDRLRTRIQLWAAEEIRLGGLSPKSGVILDALLYRGELHRGEITGLLDVGERQARRGIALLTEKGVITSESSRAPIRWCSRHPWPRAGCRPVSREDRLATGKHGRVSRGPSRAFEMRLTIRARSFIASKPHHAHWLTSVWAIF